VHSRPCGFQIASRDCLALIADAVYRDDPAVLYEKPEHTGIELPHVTQLIEPFTKRFG
jgi:hypothetical protein